MLELKDIRLDAQNVSLVYNVRHNVGRLRTTLKQDLKLQVDVNTGKVTGALHLTELEADSLEGAREKMAIWCDRMAAALRATRRKDGELPLYERRSFDLADHPLWLQQEYARLVEAYVNARTEEDHEAIKLWLKDHPMTLVSDMVESAECVAERIRETTGAHPE
ncbi:hypothetical protein WJ96_05895 [Burkholderia ubonensis]|uniref:Uncharacterized protein n=1 Tax=Burkholderia ubonensis TaxID=101571 RepID=A0AAW3MT12_9BURK|nr:hypothetical protein [Burkholderia ubonensis]KVP75288.1 hypothetical protein WJ93_07690 [Burkholderia ubonensis]KVP98101.1 hypothetical protein WJ96_05895 [Burkholderia ubonensis]KVZ92798.1 hypothetical protein WL25_17555 [Burkholderia ubonensis]